MTMQLMLIVNLKIIPRSDTVDSEEGMSKFTTNADQLGRWAKEQQIEFNSDKGEVLHFGISDQGRTCTVNVRTLENVVEQKYLAVQAHGYLKVVSQVDSVVKAAFS